MMETKADTNNLIARTGRVQGWIDDPTSRLPVSCTVIEVSDAMTDDENSIESQLEICFARFTLRSRRCCPLIPT